MGDKGRGTRGSNLRDSGSPLAVVLALAVALLVSCSSGRTPAAPPWNTVQRNLYVYGCMNSDELIEYGPAATQGYCICYQSGVEALHPYAWVVDGNSPTLAESEQIKRVEDRCKERVVALRTRRLQRRSPPCNSAAPVSESK